MDLVTVLQSAQSPGTLIASLCVYFVIIMYLFADLATRQAAEAQLEQAVEQQYVFHIFFYYLCDLLYIGPICAGIMCGTSSRRESRVQSTACRNFPKKFDYCSGMSYYKS